MRAYQNWLIAAGVLLGLALLLAMYQGFGVPGIIVILVVSAAALVTYAVLGASRIRIGEMEYGVIFKNNGDFSHFVNSGPQYINPLREHLEATLPRGGVKAGETTEKLRTSDGILVNVKWVVSGKLDPFNLSEGSRPGVTRGLIKGASGMLNGKVVPALRHLIEQKTINQLYTSGAIQALEKELSEMVTERAKGIGFKPIPPNDVQIGPITIPPEVEKTLEAAHKRDIQQSRFRYNGFTMEQNEAKG